MPIDKSWISKPQNTIEYAKGLNVFLDFAFEHGNGLVMKCPYSKCGFKKWQTRDAIEGSSVSEPLAATSADVVEDILESRNPMEDMLNDAFRFVGHDVNDFDEAIEDDDVQNNVVRDEGNTNLDALLKDNNQPLYESCTKYSKLSFMLKLYHIKCMCRMSDKAMIMIIDLLKDAFEHAKFPNSLYD